MNILCIDKTGTLTIDRIILERHLDVLGNADDSVLRYAYLNSYFIVTIGAILPFTAIGSAIGLVRLPPVYFFWLAGILVSYCLVVQTVKIWFLKQFKAWI
jgi:hypothetical protein